MKKIVIGDHLIGEGQPCFIIAEAGVNHNGNRDLAFQLIDATSDSGADAVKFQTFKAEWLVSKDAPRAKYQAENIGGEESQYEMLKRLEMPFEWHAPLKEYAESKGLVFLSTPFNKEAADFLDDLGVLAYKLSSGELNNMPFIRHIAEKGKSIFLSTGMADIDEIKVSSEVLKQYLDDQFVLLQCTTNYPVTPEDVNLAAMDTIRNTTQSLVGFSDHSVGYLASCLAVAKGACVIEKHLTLDRTMEGPDHSASVEPQEMKEFVEQVRLSETLVGDGVKKCLDVEISNADVVRKSVVTRRDLFEGDIITAEDITIKRPGCGIKPECFFELPGRKLKRSIPSDTPISWEDLS